MSLKNITQPIPSPGMIHRAKRMNVTKREDGWEVQRPFHYPHRVVKGAKFYTCDCVGFQMRGMCSHVAAVSMLQPVQNDVDGVSNEDSQP